MDTLIKLVRSIGYSLIGIVAMISAFILYVLGTLLIWGISVITPIVLIAIFLIYAAKSWIEGD